MTLLLPMLFFCVCVGLFARRLRMSSYLLVTAAAVLMVLIYLIQPWRR